MVSTVPLWSVRKRKRYGLNKNLVSEEGGGGGGCSFGFPNSRPRFWKFNCSRRRRRQQKAPAQLKPRESQFQIGTPFSFSGVGFPTAVLGGEISGRGDYDPTAIRVKWQGKEKGKKMRVWKCPNVKFRAIRTLKRPCFFLFLSLDKILGPKRSRMQSAKNRNSVEFIALMITRQKYVLCMHFPRTIPL